MFSTRPKRPVKKERENRCKITHRKSPDGRVISTEYSEGCTDKHLRLEKRRKEIDDSETIVEE